jgi:hypothetical protein
VKCPRCGTWTLFDVVECSCGWRYAAQPDSSAALASRDAGADRPDARSVAVESQQSTRLNQGGRPDVKPEAIARFRSRQKFLRAVEAIWALGWICQAPFFRSRWPALATWELWIEAIGSVPAFFVYLWAGRCTVCGGGIKFDGKTCSKCGRKFE